MQITTEEKEIQVENSLVENKEEEFICVSGGGDRPYFGV
jgi:hypothetical protein